MAKEDIEKQRNMLVIKHNDLIQQSKYNMTVNEQKLIAYIISLIKPTDKEFQTYDIKVKDFCETCGLDKNRLYTELVQIVNNLDSKTIWIKTDEKIYKFRWFLKFEYYYKKGFIRILLDNDIKKYILGLTDNFTQYELYNILRLHSKYSLRLYEIFKSYEFKQKEIIEIDKLKVMLNAEHYKNFKDFRIKVLEISLREINSTTDIIVDYETVKQGRKVIQIIFYIKRKEVLDRYENYLDSLLV